MQLIDVHAHLFDANLPVTPAEAIANAQNVGVTQFVVPGYSLETSREAIDLATQFPGICFATIGIHPHEVLIEGFDLDRAIHELQQLCHLEPVEGSSRSGQSDLSTPRSLDSDLGAQDDKVKKVVGIGEIGIDYHHHTREETGKVQREAFTAQLVLGMEHDLPIIVHGRKAYDDVLDVIRAHPGSRGLLHSFEASYEMAKQALDLGWVISFTALVTYPGNEYLLEVANKLPLDRITVETDAPYLPPQSIRLSTLDSRLPKPNDSPKSIVGSQPVGKRGVNNQPAYMVETAQKLAAARGISLEELAEVTTQTARALFQLPIL